MIHTNRGRIAGLLALAVTLIATASALAALQGDPDGERKKGKVVVGRDDDQVGDPAIQPPGVGPNQTLRKGDQLFGGAADDVMIGRLGPDTLIAGTGDDVIVGGTERGSDLTAFPNFDVAHGGWDEDVFIWAPGDGSDAFIGGDPPRKGRKGRKGHTDTLVVGTLLLAGGDNSRPELFSTRFGRWPKALVADRSLPATIGDSPPLAPIPVSCEVIGAPAGLGYRFLVRVFVEATDAQAVTIRVRGVEQVLCGTEGGDGISKFALGRRGRGPVRVTSTDFQPRAGSKLDALVD